MNKFFAWLLLSSANPSKLSLAIKGVLLGILPTVIYLTGLANLNVDGDALKAFIDGLATVIEVGLGLVASISALVGIVRKIWTTIAGSNKVINHNIKL